MSGEPLDLSDYQPSAELATAETMPSRWYTEPAFLDAEAERIFYRSWQPVGRVEDVMRIGDFFTCEVLDQPLVVARSSGGQLRAFYNVCAHRAAIVAQGRGNRKSLQCKYHGWTYDLDGKLLRAPEFEGVKGWDRDAVCLRRVQVEAWGPWVFVNLDPGAAAMSATYGEIADEISAAGFNLSRMRRVERREYEIDCNWKVYVDNYLEGYHLPIAHPGLFRELDYDQYRVETRRQLFKAARADPGRR